MGGGNGAIAGQAQSDRLRQAVHRIGGEHSGAAAAGGAGALFDGRDLAVADRGIGGLDHRVDQVEFLGTEFAGLHRAAGYEDRGNVDPHRGEEHAGRDLVAVADAYQCVGLVGVDHIFDAVGDDVAGGEGIEHPVVAHRDAVVDGDGVEFRREAAEAFDLFLDGLACVVEMDVAGNELGEGVGDGDDGLAELFLPHPVGEPQRAGSGHPASFECNTTT